MSAAGRTLVIDSFADSAFRHRDCDGVACIDVMLATTTLVTAAAAGRRVFVAADAAGLERLASRLGDVLVAGSLPGASNPCEIPDGPCALQEREDGRPLVLVSPPGTALLLNVGNLALVASFRNLSATAAALAGHQRVALLGAGDGEEFSCEDQMAAAWIAERLLERGFEPADPRTGQIVQRWRGISPSLAGWGNSAARLRHERRGSEVEFVIQHVDDLDRAVRIDGYEVRIEERTVGTAAAPRHEAP